MESRLDLQVEEGETGNKTVSEMLSVRRLCKNPILWYIECSIREVDRAII